MSDWDHNYGDVQEIYIRYKRLDTFVYSIIEIVFII